MFSAGALSAQPLREEVVVERFSGEMENGMPKGWKPFEFPKKHKPTEYTVQKDGDAVFLKAVSLSSASAIFKEVPEDPKEFPIISWKWKVDGTIEKAEDGKKEGDDYAARVYVIFEYEPKKLTYFQRLKYKLLQTFTKTKPPGFAINYVWANKLKKNETAFSPFTDTVVMIAAESGNDNIGKWVAEERNVYEDYKRFFKGEPPRIAAIAVMTDSDNTQGKATGYYADILLKRKNPVPSISTKLDSEGENLKR